MDKQIIHAVMELAQQMTQVGAEISRVEESVQRICHAYGASRVDVNATTSNIILSVEDAQGDAVLLHRRILRTGTDIEKLDHLNSLVRWMTAQTPDLAAVTQRLQALQDTKKMPDVITILFQGVIAAAFCLLFGSRDVVEMLVALLAGLLVGCLSVYLEKNRTNRIFVRFICSLLASLLVQGALHIGLIAMPDYIIIGTIMCLIPGVGLTNAIRDLFTGDVITGILRSIEALLLTLAIAVGFALPTLLLGGVL